MYYHMCSIKGSYCIAIIILIIFIVIFIIVIIVTITVILSIISFMDKTLLGVGGGTEHKDQF